MPLCAEKISRYCTLHIEPGKKVCFPCTREKKRQNARKYYGLASFKRETVVRYIVQHYHVDKTIAQIAAHFDVTPAAISHRVKRLEKEGFVFPPKLTSTKLALNTLKHQ